MHVPDIYCAGQSQPEMFAAEELQRYLQLLTGTVPNVEICRKDDADSEGLWLGCLQHFGRLSADDVVDDPRLDDYIQVRADADGGIIAGSNPRSVLLAVYQYLRKLGCRWVRPTDSGICVPEIPPPLPAVEIEHRPSYRHRGVCIEGAVSIDHVRAMIDWLPKMGFNAYYIQFRHGYNFFQRWYEHEYNADWDGEPLSVQAAREFTRQLRFEVKKRGLTLHTVGHGWTCEPLGIPGTGWFQHEGEIPEDAVKHLAKIDGERKLFGGIALNTNLCYGSKDTRDIMTDAVVDYARENTDVDIIHLWLADGKNNQCECDLCRDHRPSDLYVRLLNELDEKLSNNQLDVRIVFLAYVDLLWPPEQETIDNPDRFLLMFAPITRSYSRSFTDAGISSEPLPPYTRNELQFPSEPSVNLAFLEGWQQQFDGDSFDFDYHFMWDHYNDPAQYEMAEVLHRDIQGLVEIGLNGFMSCQTQRVFFPTGFGMTVLGRTLWDREVPLDAIAEDYFNAAFGENGGQVRDYLRGLSELFHPRVLRGDASDDERRAAIEDWSKVADITEDAEAMINRALQLDEPAHVHSWQLLKHHAEFCRLLSAALVEAHDPEFDTDTAARELIEWVREQEPKIEPFLDVYEFLRTMAPKLGISRQQLG